MKYLIKLCLCTDSDCYTSINGEKVLMLEDPIYVEIKGSKREIIPQLNKVLKEAKTLKYEVSYGKTHIIPIMEKLTSKFITHVKDLIRSIKNNEIEEGRTWHEEGGNQYFTIEVIAL